MKSLRNKHFMSLLMNMYTCVKEMHILLSSACPHKETHLGWTETFHLENFSNYLVRSLF